MVTKLLNFVPRNTFNNRERIAKYQRMRYHDLFCISLFIVTI